MFKDDGNVLHFTAPKGTAYRLPAFLEAQHHFVTVQSTPRKEPTLSPFTEQRRKRN